MSMMITKGNKCLAQKGHVSERNKHLAPKGHVSEMGVPHLASSASHMGFFTFSKFGFSRYVLSHEMETSMSSNSRFLVTISLTLNYVRT